MAQAPTLDGILIQWGDRLFYPGNRIVHGRTPKLRDLSQRQRAQAIRQRIEDTVVRRAPQVMVKVTGGGRGMKAIAAHFRYISKNGRLEIEDERGQTCRGKGVMPALVDDWRYGGSLIEETSPAARPSTSCCRCHAAPTRRSCCANSRAARSTICGSVPRGIDRMTLKASRRGLSRR